MVNNNTKRVKQGNAPYDWGTGILNPACVFVDNLKVSNICNTSINKDRYYKEDEKTILQNRLKTIGLHGAIASDYFLVGAKVVNIKEDRNCTCCGFTVTKGNLMLTGTNNPKSYSKNGTKTSRMYYCKNCIDVVLKKAWRDSNDLCDAEMHEEALHAAFYNEF